MKFGSTFKLLLLPVLLLLCTLFYYFGELADWAAWDSLRTEFFYGVHDIHRLLFLVPIIYAGYYGRVKGAIIVTLVSLAIFIPRALFVSPYPDPLLRMVLFVIIAGVFGSLTGVIRNQSEKNLRLQEDIHSEKLYAMGQIAASIAHEINNPLAGVLVYNRLLSKKLSNDSLDKEEALDTLHKIDSAVGHCSQIVQGLLDFARQSKPIYTPSDISKVIDQATSPVGHQARMNDVEIARKNTATTSSVNGDIGKLQQVFMNLIINTIQSIPDGGTVKEDALDTLHKIDSAISYCSQIVHGLLDFTRKSEYVFESLEISKVIDEAISRIGHQAEMNNVEIVRNDAENIYPVKGDIGQLQRVFMNLIINAIQAMPDGGTVTVTTGSDNNGRISVSIKDTGHGIEPENMEKLFTPLFTTTESGIGVGLGLAVSQGIIERHGGNIEVTSSIGAGSTFTVFLPNYTENSN